MIRPMTPDERQASKDKESQNNWRKCVRCGNQSRDDFCSFCLKEE